jgi:hypothetical protein
MHNNCLISSLRDAWAFAASACGYLLAFGDHRPLISLIAIVTIGLGGLLWLHSINA